MKISTESVILHRKREDGLKGEFSQWSSEQPQTWRQEGRKREASEDTKMREEPKRREHARELLFSDQMPWHLQPASRGSQCADGGLGQERPPPQQALGQRSELCPGKATAVMGMGTREGCTLPERSSITAPAPSEARAPHSLQEEGIPAWLGKCTPTFNPLAPYPHSESLVTPRTEAPGV